MKNPWAIGIILLIIFFWYSFSNFEIPTILFGPTKKLKGKIFEMKLMSYARGYSQKIAYYYEYEGRLYTGKKEILKLFGYQAIGNSLLIEVSKENPQKHKVISPYNEFRNSKGKKYKILDEYKFSEAKLVNGMFIVADSFGNVNYAGEFHIKGDTALVNWVIPVKGMKQLFLIKDKSTLMAI